MALPGSPLGERELLLRAFGLALRSRKPFLEAEVFTPVKLVFRCSKFALSADELLSVFPFPFSLFLDCSERCTGEGKGGGKIVGSGGGP